MSRWLSKNEGRRPLVDETASGRVRLPTPPRSTWNSAALGRLGRSVNGLLAALLALPVRAYRFFLSPLLPPACRHEPSCSRYALEALAVHGPWRGSWLTAGRLLRCQPWGTSGFDPVPPRRPHSSSPPHRCQSAVVPS
jgi:putative membrane protein insertion efficiency factor